MDNTEGTPKSGDSVETGRGASVSMEDLREVCRTIPHVRNLAKHYGITVPEMTAELKRQAILRFTRREDVDWSDLEAKYQEAGTMPALARMLGTTERITYKELVSRGVQQRRPGHVKGQKKSEAWREASRQHWDDPEWREEQRQKWLERLPGMQAARLGGSPLEKHLHNALRKAGISFSTQQRILNRYLADILITQKPVVIEADGNMHLHAKSRISDAERDTAMRGAGYLVFRFTGKPICNDPDGCIRQVIEQAGLTPDADPVFDIRNGMTGANNPRWKGGKQEWVCENCDKTFLSWPRGYGKPCRTCSKECQREWQEKTRASVIGRDNSPMSIRMRELWADPEWRARQVQHQRDGRWGTEADDGTVRPA
jgi:very-short-patch-repair endonuclease